jgi:uncharacterized protein YoxC
MDVAALIVAIVALLFAVGAAGFGVFIQFQTYKATTDHLRSVEGSVSGFRTDMQGLIGELKGMTDSLVHAQQEQFNRMLDAFVTRPGAAAEVAERTGESADRLQQISQEMDALKEELRQAASADEVQRKLDELASRLEAVSASTAQAARLAGRAATGGASGPPLWKTVGHLRGVYVDIKPLTIVQGGFVDMRVASFFGLDQIASVTCIVASPTGQTWTSEWKATTVSRWDGPMFRFPDHFRDAVTEEVGSYEATFVEVAANGSVVQYLGGRFHITEPGSRDE